MPLCGEIGGDIETYIYNRRYFENENYSIASKFIDFACIYQNNIDEQVQIVNMLYEKLDIRKQYLTSDFTIRAPHDPRERKGVTRRTGKKGAPLQLGIREAKINRSYTYHRMNKTRVPKS